MAKALPDILPCPRCGRRPQQYETDPFVKGLKGFYCQDQSHSWEPFSSEPEETLSAAIRTWNAAVSGEKEKSDG
jgi:hypothetical protein